MGLFTKFFGSQKSGKIARDRLQLVLVHDRSDISPEMMENLRRDIITVIKNYVEIDENRIELDLEREDSSVALVANIPVMTVRRQRGKAGR
ncbi:MAG: cell division topological specificity factor MinE [Synergistaceae bacterium]|jgi:cell division topological specificity factor|nr:cell division topological specificity factor MinE [Synergistaceae bacterium]